ncbi:Imm26 family immunity protein [Ramlibacter sp.]|uniref:Imm26 family immunity protein n=1 Tax=Ramlibacter sp. TaxID=1917967 RepID=UPI0017BB99DC|nr:Imm26 family immunity protein [Ramlibacter sp.]MBA2672617.1 hypothetical protein [Ramlibacter sp.]
METQEVLLGNIYAIPGGGKYAYGKVIYLSEYFKDVMLVRLFAKAYSSPDAPPEGLDSLPSTTVFAGKEAITKGVWVLVGSASVSNAERALTRRVVGGDVWIEDSHVGPASDEDLRVLPQMDVYGYRLIEKKVARLA